MSFELNSSTQIKKWRIISVGHTTIDTVQISLENSPTSIRKLKEAEKYDFPKILFEN